MVSPPRTGPAQGILSIVTGILVGKGTKMQVKAQNRTAKMLTGMPHLPRVQGPKVMEPGAVRRLWMRRAMGMM